LRAELAGLATRARWGGALIVSYQWGNFFGQWCLIREWGRIGGGGQMRMIAYATAAQAHAALACQRRVIGSGTRRILRSAKRRSGKNDFVAAEY
jgi:predicted DNA-binding WGR domain protein